MAHQARIAVATRNVGWFGQNWRYDYNVTWLGGNGSIREVKIGKTIAAGVTAPLRIGAQRPFFFRDPRLDIGPPSEWTLNPNVAAGTQFEFMIQPPAVGGPLPNFLPALAPPPPFAPIGPPPVTGQFRVYSVENPVPQQGITVDHLGAQVFHSTIGPDTKIQCAGVTATVTRVKGGYRYTYTLFSRFGPINQAILFLDPSVQLQQIVTSEKAWATYRPGIDRRKRGDKPDGKPTAAEKGILLYFGSFKRQIGPGDPPVRLSFVSKATPGCIIVLSNKFCEPLQGPVLLEENRY